MTGTEDRLREAAKDFREAIIAAEADGLRVTWPQNADGLVTIEVSETATATTPIALAAPVTVPVTRPSGDAL